jgi:actin-like ATPase involved in cell morphogenesis
MSARHDSRSARQPRILALDLGSTMTRFCVTGEDEIVSHPTLMLYDRAGKPVAAGWDAWHMALDEPDRLWHPVLGGVVSDADGCANMLRLLLAEAGMSRVDSVALSLPAVAGRQDTARLASVVSVAANAPIVLMRPAVAAAASRDSTGGDLPTGLVVDIGAGVVEVGAFHGRRMGAQAGTKVLTHAFVDEPTLVVGELLRLVNKTLGEVPSTVAEELVKAPVTLIGGAQQSRPLFELICYGLHLDITAADRPETAVVSGLAREVSGMLSHAQC